MATKSSSRGLARKGQAKDWQSGKSWALREQRISSAVAPFSFPTRNHTHPYLTHDQRDDIRPKKQWLQPLGARSASCRAHAGSPICSRNSESRASSLLLTQLLICLPESDSSTAHGQGGTAIAEGEADMQLRQQQAARRGVRRAARTRTRLSKGMVDVAWHCSCMGNL